MSSRASGQKGRSRKKADSWSAWYWDERGWWYRSRTGPSGGPIYEYDYSPGPEPTTGSANAGGGFDGAQDSEPAQETPRDDPVHTPIYNFASTASSISPTANMKYTNTSGYDPSRYSVEEIPLADNFRSLNINEGGAYLGNPRQASAPQSQATDPNSRFEIVKDGRKFFKVGRVFKMMWAEPAGSDALDDSFVTTSSLGEKVFSKIRRFVVIREQKGCSVCLPINTYGEQGANKPGLVPGDHAAVYDSNNKPPRPSPKEGLTKEAFPIIVEPPGEKINPMSRINFGKVHTVEHNFKVMKVGRIATKEIPRLKRYFFESFLGETAPLSPGPTEEMDKYQSMTTPVSSNNYGNQSGYATSSGQTLFQSSTTSGNSYGSSTYDYPASAYPSEAQMDSPQTSSYPSTTTHYPPQQQTSVHSIQDGYSSQNYNTQSQLSYPVAPSYSSQYAAPASPYQSHYGAQAPVQTTVPAQTSYQRAYQGSYGTNPSGQYTGYGSYNWRGQ